MSIELADVKKYLRVDADITIDDDLIESQTDAAKEYLVEKTGKAYVSTKLYDQAIKMLVLHWYENRNMNNSKIGSSVYEPPHTITALMNHIALCSAYAAQSTTATTGSDGT